MVVSRRSSEEDWAQFVLDIGNNSLGPTTHDGGELAVWLQVPRRAAIERLVAGTVKYGIKRLRAKFLSQMVLQRVMRTVVNNLVSQLLLRQSMKFNLHSPHRPPIP